MDKMLPLAGGSTVDDVFERRASFVVRWVTNCDSRMSTSTFGFRQWRVEALPKFGIHCCFPPFSSPWRVLSFDMSKRSHAHRHWKYAFLRMLQPWRARRIPWPVFLMIGVQVLWILFDRQVTSKIYHQPPKPYVPPTESSPLSPFYGSDYLGTSSPPARTYPSRQSFPCGPLMSETAFNASTPEQSGIFFIPTPFVKHVEDVAGMTARIARNVALRQHGSERTHNLTACTARLNVPLKTKRFRNRRKSESFLFSFVQEPVARMVDAFFKISGATEKTPNADRFRSFLESQGTRNYGIYLRNLSPRRHLNPQRQELRETYIKEILEAMDYIGLAERWEESLAVLQLLLGLETQDILYLPPSMTQYDYVKAPDPFPFSRIVGTNPPRCVPKPSTMYPLFVKEILHDPDLYDEFFDADIAFYRAVSASLDATIAGLGRNRVDAAIQNLRAAQSLVQCQARFPCDSHGRIQLETDCFFSHVGCGYACLDTVGTQLTKST